MTVLMVRGGVQSKKIAVAAEAGNDPPGGAGNIGIVAELLALINIGQVHLDHRDAAGLQGIEDGYRRMGVAAGIENDGVEVPAALLNPVDQITFAVALAAVDGQAEFAGPGGTGI